MGHMVTRVGMIGMSPGNGHPFSFSAIINGFSEDGMKVSGWPVIHEYLRQRRPEEFGVGSLHVTHAWTQEPSVTAALCRATKIEHGVERPEQMLGEVDALIIARDDAGSHWPLARRFLAAGLPVFIDKPLTLDRECLMAFRPYLEKGQLMTCSGMRYAKELDVLREQLCEHGSLRLVRGTIVNDWERYGIHLLEALLSLLPGHPTSVCAVPTGHETLLIRLDDGTPLIIDALGEVPPVFDIEVFGSRRVSRCSITDNFSMFRRLLFAFSDMVTKGSPSIPAEESIRILSTLIAGREALDEGGQVDLRQGVS
ncbi:Gfo/Idh/MocA family oxidoreductase [Halomonas sp. LR5S13]|uniref:Gfo/Idh/MocA family oxidoreductase n=1 Tax=Halomonas rhizosphaerae TaxID=3043296 RepID=UPI0024A88D0D|nr:Gfo/Idh/MocA family oxidoreductase [Halomonas rhizosphaerae]MDI5920864.1 Gfo/Idh/MocA family oxidoreductase [Halomonas rhizosphaerae]